VKIDARVLAVRDWKNQKKTKKIVETKVVRMTAYAQKQNPLSDAYYFLVAWGQISPFPVGFYRRPYKLQHSRTTVRVCDSFDQMRHIVYCPHNRLAVAQ